MQEYQPQLKILPDCQKELWEDFKKSLPKHFVLYGGTAIALQLGHRQSVDFDLFTSKELNPDYLLNQIDFLKSAKIIQLKPDALSVIIEKKEPVKISFFGNLTFGRVNDPLKPSGHSLLTASLIDLLGHKLKVILQRPEEKDYLDIISILKSGITLNDGLSSALGLFPNMFAISECLKALVYFEDGDLRQLDSNYKEFLKTNVRQVEKSIYPKPLKSKALHIE